ncbi:hypothetical protein ET495_12290 [Xylanimonas allomyrinae]|uniref:LytR family transcriptional regulator n=1 Tax=Xylanimonas allomyrinae TaxID=2509459 RepID=A0A4P6EPY4_9MICO|nr:hypothetical protein [Xylanimonas allomyrinae]QAY63883.1 hypothetical protein ET495_12290 [Xylanimonas allomyrinae]
MPSKAEKPAADDAAVRHDGDAAARPARSLWGRAWRGGLVGLLVLTLLALGDAALLVCRVERVDLPALAGDDPGTTWVIVGSDNRAYRPSGGREIALGDSWDGDHADAVLVVHETRDGTHALSLPRDLYVTPAGGGTPTGSR